MNSSNELFAMGNSSGFHWTDLLLAEVELTPQYILEVADGCWECRCGNKSNSDGFETCSEFGVLVPSELGLWDGVLWHAFVAGESSTGTHLRFLVLPTNQLFTRILNFNGVKSEEDKRNL